MKALPQYAAYDIETYKDICEVSISTNWSFAVPNYSLNRHITLPVSIDLTADQIKLVINTPTEVKSSMHDMLTLWSTMIKDNNDAILFNQKVILYIKDVPIPTQILITKGYYSQFNSGGLSPKCSVLHIHEADLAIIVINDIMSIYIRTDTV